MLEAISGALTPFLWGGALALFLNVPLRTIEGWLGRLPPKPRRCAALTVLLLALAAALALWVWLLARQLAGGSGTGGTFVGALVLAVYLLADKEGLARRCGRVLQAVLGAEQTGRVLALARRAERVFSQFIAGQCIEACILAGLFVLALFVFRMPSVLPIAAVIGVTALVPVFGSFVGCAVGVALILPQSVQKAGWFILLFLCVQQFENNVIYPRVVGGRIGLPPLWVLAAVILGGELFGVAGLLLGIPAMSVVYHVGGEWVRARLARADGG